MAKALLKEIIPEFGLPGSLQTDNGPAFVSLVNECPGHKTDLALSLEIPITLESREMQADLKTCFSQAMSGNSRKLD